MAGVGTPPDHTSASMLPSASCASASRSRYVSMSTRSSEAGCLEQHAAGHRTAGSRRADGDAPSLQVCELVRASEVAHDHLQIVLVHPGHRYRGGSRGACRAVPLGNVGQRQAHIDVPRAQAGQVIDGALGGEHVDGDARIAGVELIRKNLRECQIHPAGISCGQAQASAGLASDAAAGGQCGRRENECATAHFGRSVVQHVGSLAAGRR